MATVVMRLGFEACGWVWAKGRGDTSTEVLRRWDVKGASEADEDLRRYRGCLTLPSR